MARKAAAIVVRPLSGITRPRAWPGARRAECRARRSFPSGGPLALVRPCRQPVPPWLLDHPSIRRVHMRNRRVDKCTSPGRHPEVKRAGLARAARWALITSACIRRCNELAPAGSGDGHFDRRAQRRRRWPPTSGRSSAQDGGILAGHRPPGWRCRQLFRRVSRVMYNKSVAAKSMLQGLPNFLDAARQCDDGHGWGGKCSSRPHRTSYY